MKEEIDESIYLRVTTPLARYSGYEAVPLPVLNYAADRGTRVHQYCELYANNMLFGEIDLDCFEYVQAFINWFDENVEEVILTEKRFFCENYKLQGQIDMIARVKGYEGNCLVDLKTSLNPSKTWNLQTAAYQWLAMTNEVQVDHRLVIQVKKDVQFEIYSFPESDYKDEIDLYRGILKAHRYFS